jgi:putative ABC transport system permease protein
MWLDHAWRDLRYAVRTLSRTPGVTAVAALTLALGIGANTAMFSIVYGILLRPLPYQHTDRLVLIQREQDLSGTHRPVPAPFFAQPEIDAWRQRLQSFESTALYSNQVAALPLDTGTEVLDSAVVSDTFFSILAGPMVAGRPLGPADDLAPSVVISERLGQRLFGRSSGAVGQPITLSSRTYTVVGVADAAFQFPSGKTDVWIPAGYMRLNPRCCSFRMFGRLRSDVTITQAGAEAAAAAKALAGSGQGRPSEMRATVVSLRDQIVGTVRPALLILFAAVSLVLLVACANVANLLLARHVARGREVAIQWALGASRGRVLQQTLIESALLAVSGAMAGIVLAIACVRVLARLNPPGVPRLDAVHVDVPVLLFSLALAGLVTVATGILPAFQSTNPNALKSGVASVTTAQSRVRIRRVLCAAELAVSLVLLVGASLLGRSLVRLMHTDLGVTADHVVTASMTLAFGGRPTDAQALERVERVIERIQTLPGVHAVGAGTALPPNASRLTLTLRRAGEAVDYLAAGVAVTPGYFQALGMRLVRGRLFTDEDDMSHPPVMIMSIDTAKRFFGDGDPIGRTMSLPVLRNGKSGREDMTLVGTIANVKYSGLDAAADDAVYRPFRQQPWVAPYLVVRTTGEPGSLVPTLRREIAMLDRAIVLADVTPLDAIISNAAAQPRFRTVLLGSIAGLALVMAVVGLYGVVAYSVSQRTREIGIRMALGAGQDDILGMVLREGLILAGFGILGGVVSAYAATRALSGLLYGVAATDALSFGFAGGSLFIVALVASYVPAHRAMKVDPLVALRVE